MTAHQQTPEDSYARFRTCSCRELWEKHMPRFDRLTGRARLDDVGLVRAVGVVFAEHGSEQEKASVRAWMRTLLQDPEEKIRRYAINALPKLASGPGEEQALLALLARTASEREKTSLTTALDKIGGRATLELLDKNPGLSPVTQQRIRANVARGEGTGGVVMDRNLSDIRGLRIHLRGRRGLEPFVREELEHHPRTRDRFQVIEAGKGLVALRPLSSFSLGDLYSLRCCGSVGFVVGLVKESTAPERTEAMARAIASPISRRLFQSFHQGPPRYRLEFLEPGNTRNLVRDIAARAFALCPDILNDSHQAPWAIDVHRTKAGESLELRPRLSPDPRFSYRVGDVAAASHPPLAACLARWAGRTDSPERIWDPFCGSGLELIESALLGRVQEIHGTDLSAEALAITRANLEAASLAGVKTRLTCCDFRDFQQKAGIQPDSLTLVISNPPLGRRIRIPNLRGLMEDLLRAAATVLQPGGRLVFTNPMKLECPVPSLQLESRIMADLGGFDCRLEKYVKVPAETKPPRRPVEPGRKFPAH